MKSSKENLIKASKLVEYEKHRGRLLEIIKEAKLSEKKLERLRKRLKKLKRGSGGSLAWSWLTYLKYFKGLYGRI
ncbi:MAG TPA: hypothetical protein ENF87_00275 [Thermoproteales archaeon]|nr:hypothetical protein [Thermoproteales archaeon]